MQKGLAHVYCIRAAAWVADKLINTQSQIDSITIRAREPTQDQCLFLDETPNPTHKFDDTVKTLHVATTTPTPSKTASLSKLLFCCWLTHRLFLRHKVE